MSNYSDQLRGLVRVAADQPLLGEMCQLTEEQRKPEPRRNRRIKAGAAGRCLFLVSAGLVPACVKVTIDRTAIRPDGGEFCPVFQPLAPINS